MSPRRERSTEKGAAMIEVSKHQASEAAGPGGLSSTNSGRNGILARHTRVSLARTRQRPRVSRPRPSERGASGSTGNSACRARVSSSRPCSRGRSPCWRRESASSRGPRPRLTRSREYRPSRRHSSLAFAHHPDCLERRVPLGRPLKPVVRETRPGPVFTAARFLDARGRPRQPRRDRVGGRARAGQARPPPLAGRLALRRVRLHGGGGHEGRASEAIGEDGGLLGGVLPGPGQSAHGSAHAGEAAHASGEGTAEDCT